MKKIVKVLSFKGNEIGYTYFEDTDTYEWYTDEPVIDETAGNVRETYHRTYTGEWAAQAARIRFLENIGKMFDNYLKKIFRSLGIDPATGHREKKETKIERLQ